MKQGAENSYFYGVGVYKGQQRNTSLPLPALTKCLPIRDNGNGCCYNNGGNNDYHPSKALLSRQLQSLGNGNEYGAEGQDQLKQQLLQMQVQQQQQLQLQLQLQSQIQQLQVQIQGQQRQQQQQQRSQIADIEMDVLINKLKASAGAPGACDCSSSSLEGLLEYNKQWAKRVNEISPTFFTEGAKSQHPEYLWIGCSDSRVVPNTMLGLIPGEIFVHRNIANVIPRSDINATSVIQFSVEYLKVKEIIVCGHQNCKGIAVTYATIGGPSGSLKAGKAIVSTNGTVDNWIVNITEVLNRHLPLLNSIPNENNRPNALSEINVVEQLVNVAESVSVHTRWCEERQGNVGSGGDKKYPHKLRLNGWMYMLTTGLIEPVCTFTAEDDVRQKASETIKKIIEKYSKAK